jgi:hypothetical protein
MTARLVAGALRFAEAPDFLLAKTQLRVALAASPPVSWVRRAAHQKTLADKPTTVRLKVEETQLVMTSGCRVWNGLLV